MKQLFKILRFSLLLFIISNIILFTFMGVTCGLELMNLPELIETIKGIALIITSIIFGGSLFSAILKYYSRLEILIRNKKL